MTEYTFSRFIYLDTNIISYFVKNEELWSSFFAYLKESGLTVGIGGGQISELSDAKSLLTDLARFLINVPTGLIKNWDEIISEEVFSHPSMRTDSLLIYPLNAVLLEEEGIDNLIRFLNSKSLTDARRDQLKLAKSMKKQLTKLKRNFPPTKSGRYEKSQAEEFAKAMITQWLAFDHRPFLKQIQQDISAFDDSVFKSIRLYAYILFYKYYLGQREPNKLSDFGDLFHLFSIPYCEIVVMERDLANVLNQIKSNQDILQKTEVHNIDFLKRFGY